ncbi:MAG: DUF1648 domain-containing protein [Candidatus Zixiibacteriota bacterium]
MNAPQTSGIGAPTFPERTIIEKAAELIAVGALALTFILVYYYWNRVPGRIPIHFGFSGEPDRWGDKIVLLVVVFVQTVIYLLMTFFSDRPSIYALPLWLIQPEREKMRAMMRQMLILVKAEVMAMLTFIIWTTIHVAIGDGQSLSVKYMILFVTLLLVTVAGYTIRLFRAG